MKSNKIPTENKKYTTNICYEESPNHIKIVNPVKNSKIVVKEKNQMEEPHYSDLIFQSKIENINVKKPKQFAHTFPHNQCFFLTFQEKYFVLSRIQNKKFHIEEKIVFNHNPEIYNEYLAQRMKTFQTIVQFGSNSSKQVGKVFIIFMIVFYF